MSPKILRAVVLGTLILASLIFIWLKPDFVSELRDWLALSEATTLIILTLLFVFFCVSQLLILPSGTALLLLTGAIIGPISGVLYFVAMTITAPMVYSLTHFSPERAKAILAGYSSKHPKLLTMQVGLSAAQRKPIMTVASLRLMPMVPSAVAVIIASTIGLSLKSIVLGTLTGGFVRPLTISMIGSAIVSYADPNEPISDRTLLILILFGIMTLVASSVLALLVVRTSRQTPKTDG